MTTPIRIGTCSFADEALTKVFYPPGVRTGSERLAYYATVFDTVEVDSTFYRLQPPETVAKWADAVPNGFVFHVKAFGPMTRHGVKHEVLPPELQQALKPDERGRVERMPREARAVVFRAFREMVEPLREAGKLGSILLQLAPYVVVKPRSLEYLEWARAQLEGYDAVVEFRHRSWFEDEHRADTLAFLDEHGYGNVVVDAPRSEAKNLIPTVVALTSPTAYVRFHGRNAKTWNVRGGTAADRFDYLYPEDELEEWVEPMRGLAQRAEQAYALMNTNAYGPSPRGDRRLAQGPENGLALARVLHGAGVPATP
ncbi:MAG TPA: DUF72 domain-containing protein [Gaiellaceae bacterium]|nr:DUF72 domain-containing protein [Gaiellaceae bacterium]